MKINKNRISFLWLTFLFFGMHARYVHVKNQDLFEKEINNNQFVVACFLNNFQEDYDTDKDAQKDINGVRKIVKAASMTEPFNKLLKQEVGFLVIDMHKDSGKLLAEKYNIALDGTPAFLLFKDGKVVQTSCGDDAKLTGCIAKADLLDFMNDYFGTEFDDILEEKSQQQAQDREMQLARYQAIGASRYPYGGWAPYNPWGSPAGYIYTGYAAFYPYGYSYNGYAYFLP